MKRPVPKGRYAAEFILVLVFALCVLLVILIHTNPEQTRYARALNSFFILKPDHVSEETIPEYAGIRRVYTFTIPESNSATTTGANLTFYLRHTYAQYRIEGSALDNSSIGEAVPHIGNTPGNCWISIPMRPVYAGKTLQVTLTPAYSSVRNDTPAFMIITRDALLTMIELPKDGFLLILSLLAVILGAFLALFSLFLPLNVRDKRRIFYLGTVTFMAGLWKLCGLPVLTLMLNHWGLDKEIWYTGSVSYILMLVISLRLLELMRSENNSRPAMLCFYFSAGLAALLLMLQVFRLVDLHEVLIWYGVCVALLHLISLSGTNPTRLELLWLLLFFLTLGVDLIIFFITGSMRTAPVFLCFFIFSLIVRGFGFVREAVNRERELRKKEEELRDTRIQSMINQIRPHFIYNILTTIYVLCRDDPSLAMKVIQDFTAYLQANFTAISAREPITFSDELRHTKAYISVESLRYGDKLNVVYDIRHTAFRLPALTLQPLVENAVKHCLGKGIGPEHIRVSTWTDNKASFISVADDGPGIDIGAGGDQVHVGLQNVRERLEMMCGGTLNIKNANPHGTIVTVLVPCRDGCGSSFPAKKQTENQGEDVYAEK